MKTLILFIDTFDFNTIYTYIIGAVIFSGIFYVAKFIHNTLKLSKFKSFIFAALILLFMKNIPLVSLGFIGVGFLGIVLTIRKIIGFN